MRRFSVAWWAYSFPLTVLALAAAEYAQEVREVAASVLMLALAILSVAVTLALMLVASVLLLQPSSSKFKTIEKLWGCPHQFYYDHVPEIIFARIYSRFNFSCKVKKHIYPLPNYDNDKLTRTQGLSVREAQLLRAELSIDCVLPIATATNKTRGRTKSTGSYVLLAIQLRDGRLDRSTDLYKKKLAHQEQPLGKKRNMDPLISTKFLNGEQRAWTEPPRGDGKRRPGPLSFALWAMWKRRVKIQRKPSRRGHLLATLGHGGRRHPSSSRTEGRGEEEKTALEKRVAPPGRGGGGGGVAARGKVGARGMRRRSARPPPAVAVVSTI
uniref:Uncharacterized protein OSJNBa0049B20.14 n=1 Tax=Oryza sativa subsp. japonica TaxID=39947 RepID=Q9XHX9_ORYSJ|nr:unknown protein [Oryza sativa Japonica Group]